MNGLFVITLLLAGGVAAFLGYAGQALLVLAKRGHRHKWATLRTVAVYNSSSKMPVAHDYELRCEECGNIKRKRV